MRIARGLSADQENDFEIYSNDSLKSRVCFSGAGSSGSAHS